MKILVVTDRIITPEFDGASLRMQHLLRMFRADSSQVSLLSLMPESWPPFLETLNADRKALIADGILLPEENAAEHLQRFGADYDLIVLSGFAPALQLIEQARSCAPKAKLIFDTVDLRHLREFREAKISGNANALRRALESKRLEFDLMRRADAVFVVSSFEAELLKKEGIPTPTFVISNVHQAIHADYQPQGRNGLLFVGMFQHAPNIDAALYFAHEIWPQLLKQMPETKLYLIGAAPTSEISALNSENLIVTGQVNDLRPYFLNCRMSIAPLRFGAGIKGKVLESMAHGLPVVGTTIAGEGIAVRHSENMLLAETPADFVEQICALSAEDQLWSQLSAGGMQIVDQNFSPAVVRQQLDKSLACLFESGR